ncbi:Response regulator PleD [Thalassocella blandensis]|nr:Response regulator PleD [Thalassocella blandensis]
MAGSTQIDAKDSIEKPRILLVDDSKMVRVTAKKYLSVKFDVVLAEDGEQAWEKICADETIQVIFTDLGMPNLDGFGLIERVRQSQDERIRNQPMIVITGASEDEDIRRRVFEVGATDFITKPFKSTELIARAEAHATYRKDKDSLQKNVDMDLLTGTLNLAGLQEQLERDVSFVNRHSENLAIVLFELDNFNEIYKKLGKQNSEALLKQAASILLKAIRKEDSIGRYGVDKFSIILPMAKTEGVILLAKRICEKISLLKMSIAGDAFSVSMSAGVASVRKGSRASAKALFKLSENALTNAKKLGPGEVQFLKLEESGAPSRSQSFISIDGVLEQMKKGDVDLTVDQLQQIASQLSPLIAQMSKEQRQRLLQAP